ncbi:MAG: glycosyltransferase [Armatimonadota bacterium]|nr:glycosyltransferase [Armatimonadota bacterium]
MQSAKPTFSVVITTEHEEESLLATLTAVAGQDVTPGAVEILITDYAPEPREDTVRRLAGNLRAPAHYYRLPGARPFAARNVGIREAGGDIVLFTDDDCVPPPGWLRAYQRAFENPEVGVAGGPDKAPSSVRPFLRALEYVLTSFAGAAGLRGSGSLSARTFYPRSWNMAVSRKALERVGLFDESLPGAQDYDLVLRVREAGLGVELLPDCVVSHRRDTNLPGLLLSGLRSSMGRAYIARIRPGSGRFLHALPATGGLLYAGLLAASAFTPAAATLLAGLASAYLVLLLMSCLHAAFVMKNPRMLALVPVAMVAQHAAHAAGFLVGSILGLLSRRRKR